MDILHLVSRPFLFSEFERRPPAHEMATNDIS